MCTTAARNQEALDSADGNKDALNVVPGCNALYLVDFLQSRPWSICLAQHDQQLARGFRRFIRVSQGVPQGFVRAVSHPQGNQSVHE